MSISEHSDLGPVVDSSTAARSAAQRLRNTLRLNATTSVLGGLVAVAAAGLVDDVLGTGEPTIVRLVGAALCGFAIDVAVVAGARTSLLRRWTPVITGLDAAWVLATALTIALGWYSVGGATVLGAVAAVVAAFGVLQARHLARTNRLVEHHPIGERPPVEVARATGRIALAPEAVWPVVVDHQLYGRLATNLAAVRADGPNGPGLTRVCTDRAGRDWSERCTRWQEGQGFEIAVDPTDHPYPLTDMRGAWWVEPVPDGGSLVGMDFRYRPERGLRGRLVAAVMQAGFAIVLPRIIRGWRAEAQRRSAATKP